MSEVRAEDVFLLNSGCPLCRRPSQKVMVELNYYDTAEANRALPDVHGKLYRCDDCGVAYPSHQYTPAAFPLMYSKSLDDHSFFDDSPMQKLRMAYMKGILRQRHRPWTWSQFLDRLSFRVLQVPVLSQEPKGRRILDVGCGLGEFTRIFRDLGNDVVGTEIIPALIERNRRRGLDCRDGELESLQFAPGSFDLILLRAVFYRTRQPAHALELIRNALAPTGEISLVDPSLDDTGAEYMLRKQFPQGQLYILDPQRYFAVLESRFGLQCVSSRRIYGRPSAPLKKVRWLGNLLGLSELILNNMLRRKPYVMAYNLRKVEPTAARAAA